MLLANMCDYLKGYFQIYVGNVFIEKNQLIKKCGDKQEHRDRAYCPRRRIVATPNFHRNKVIFFYLT